MMRDRMVKIFIILLLISIDPSAKQHINVDFTDIMELASEINEERNQKHHRGNRGIIHNAQCTIMNYKLQKGWRHE